MHIFITYILLWHAFTIPLQIFCILFIVQLLERARARGERLHEAQQRLVGLAQSLEDMLAMLTEYQALLATKEADPIPHDLNVVKELLKEHQV